jgi:DNA-binding NtrC family response regulator
MEKIIVLDDDHVFRKNLCRALVGRGYDVYPAENGEDALRLASERYFDAAFIDMKMPGMNGFEVIKALKEVQPSIIGIILTGYGSINDAVKAIKLGGYHYLTKPCDMGEIEDILKKVSEERKKTHWDGSHAGVYQGIVGSSPAIGKVIGLIKKVKDSSLPVLISGESGTGKELVAKAIHFDGSRREHSFVAINCATLKPELLENELFGHVKGAFTGAVDCKEGLVKMADKGTLFIDEIADMNLAVQAGLLRFIETGIYRPMGANREIAVEARCVAAINRNIEEEVRLRRFRLDLYYRLNVCRINIPPLRERKEDIPDIAGYFLSSFPALAGRNVTLSYGAADRLASHNWPGNVRELCHLLQRALLSLSEAEDTITAGHIEQSLQSGGDTSIQDHQQHGPSCSLEETERRHISASLDAHGWNISRAAIKLGIDRRTLQRKIGRYQIRRCR